MRSGILGRLARLAMLALLVAVALAPRGAAVQAATAYCTASVTAPARSGTIVSATATISCNAPTYIRVDGTLRGPNGAVSSNHNICFSATSCSATVQGTFAYGTWTATASGFYGSGTQVQPVSRSTTFAAPQ